MASSCQNLNDNRRHKLKAKKRNCKPVDTNENGYNWVGKGKNKMYLKRHDMKTTWLKATSVCRSEHATLLMPDTQMKMKAIKGKVFQMKDAVKRVKMWIGLREYGKSEFKWTDGRPTTFTDWLPGQPDPYIENSARNEECVGLVYHLIKGLHWCDLRCNDNKGFICEKK